MGGQLFGLERVDRREYNELEKELCEYLDSKFPELYRIPRYYSSKPNFGDIDVLLSNQALISWESSSLDIVADLGVKKFQMKGNTLSLAFKDKIQADISIIPHEHIHSQWQFLCYNDLGNLLGKIFRRFGLKYGERGLLYEVRRPNQLSWKKDITLTEDMEKILGYLGLKLEDWERGFDTLEEMFDWVVGCEYFSVSPYLRIRATNSKPAQKRTTVQKFVEYIDHNKIDKQYKFNSDRSEYLPRICEYFSDVPLSKIIEEEQLKAEYEDVIRKKFNGKLVMNLFPELKGPALGSFIADFKCSFADFDSEIFVLSDDEIRQQLVDFHSNRQSKEINED